MKIQKNNAKRGHTRHKGHGPSSFWMQDPGRLFEVLGLKAGDRVLDLGCGAGDYAMEAAGIVGRSGRVTCLDHWPPTVAAVENQARDLELSQVTALVADITGPLPVEDRDTDLCLIFTVLHILDLEAQGPGLYREVARVMKPGGRLAVIECKKEDWNFGPPKHMRLSPEAVEASANTFGFRKISLTDLGYNYLILFDRPDPV